MNWSSTLELLEKIQKINEIQNVFLQLGNISEDNTAEHSEDGGDVKHLTGEKILEFFKDLDELTQENIFL